jgi:hypothetical protein
MARLQVQMILRTLLCSVCHQPYRETKAGGLACGC